MTMCALNEVKGMCGYYGHSDVYFAYYNGNTWLEDIPQKGNSENLGFEKAVCDNNTTVEWDEDKWAPIVLNLTKAKTRCTLYFSKATAQFPGKKIPIAEAGTDGLYKIYHDISIYTSNNPANRLGNEWNKTEYRYAGANPDNYVSFNNEIWRIIGLVNVKTDYGATEQRLKLIRKNDTSGQEDFIDYSWWPLESGKFCNDWTASPLKDMLNSGYYAGADEGKCYLQNQQQCSYAGLMFTEPDTIAHDIAWNVGGIPGIPEEQAGMTADMYYGYERGTFANDYYYPLVWSQISDSEHSPPLVGLMYPSDYGYAVGGAERNSCLKRSLTDENEDLSGNIINYCFQNNWLTPTSTSTGLEWLMSPADWGNQVPAISVIGSISLENPSGGNAVEPVVYLSDEVIIGDGDGSYEEPFTLTLPE